MTEYESELTVITKAKLNFTLSLTLGTDYRDKKMNKQLSMKRIKRISLLSVLSLILLCGCDGNVSSPGLDNTDDSHNAAEEATHIVEEAPVAPDYLGTDDWNLDMFSDSSIKFNIDLALAAAEMSEKCEEYEDDKIRNLLKDYGIYAVETYNYGGDSAFAIGQDTFTKQGQDTTILVIVARGTKELGEIIGDIFKGTGDDKFHSFLGESIYDNVYDFEEEIWNGLKDYLNAYSALRDNKNDLKIIVTGHSLGGAAANLIGARLTEGSENINLFSRSISPQNIYVYTFGAIKNFPYENYNASKGYENIHNIYNYYDSYGPNGNQAGRHVSSPNAKFGHTELYELKSDEIVAITCNSHLMSNYKQALQKQRDKGNFIKFACEMDDRRDDENDAADTPKDNKQNEEEKKETDRKEQRGNDAGLEIPPAFSGERITIVEEPVESHCNAGLTYVDGKTGDTYLYTAPRDGIYGFMLYDVNDDVDLGVDVYDRFNEQIMNDYSYTGSAKLKAGESYIVTVYCRYGNSLTGYKLDICPPKPMTDISGATEISDQITYYNEENTYSFTAQTSGRYRYDIIRPDKSYFHIDIYDPEGNELVDDNSGGYYWECEAGKTYRIVISGYENSYCGYRLVLGYAKDTVDISQYNIIKDSVEYLNQKNVYIYTAQKDGRYSFELSSVDNNACFEAKLLDKKDNRLFSISSGKAEIDLEAGVSYKLVIEQKEKTGFYDMKISVID